MSDGAMGVLGGVALAALLRVAILLVQAHRQYRLRRVAETCTVFHLPPIVLAARATDNGEG